MYLLIDCHGLCHWFAHSLGALRHGDNSTGVIFGFLREILTLQRTLGPKGFVFAWDSSKSARRRIFPAYKNKPEPSEADVRLYEDTFPQFGMLRDEILPLLGFTNNLMQSGREADDIIASVTTRTRYSFVIVSGDNDLWQLINKRVSQYDPRSRKMMTARRFKNQWGFHPKKWRAVKSIAGCSTDKVPGIPGVGNSTAVGYLMGTMNKKTKTYDKIISKEGLATREFTGRLTNLPFEPTKSFTIQQNMCNPDRFKIIARRYGLTSLLRDFSEWELACTTWNHEVL